MSGPWLLPLRYARRELRAGIRGWRIFLLCLIVGVAAITLVQATSQGILGSMQANGRTLLGGDMAVRGTVPLDPAAEAWLAARRARLMQSVEMRTMLRAETGEGTAQLVELKAVERQYPFYGEALVTDLAGRAIASPLDELLHAPVVVSASAAGPEGPDSNSPPAEPVPALAERALFDRMAARPGDVFSLGNGRVRLVGVLEREPDKVGSASLGFGPRLLIARDALASLGLMVPGALIYHHAKIALPVGTDATETAAAFEKQFPDAGRVRTYLNASPQLERFIERLSQFLTLIGLTALLVGGVGIANAVRAWLDARLATLATFKALGATGGFLFQSAMAQVLIIAALGTLVGLAIGLALPPLIGPYLSRALQMQIDLALAPRAWLVSSAFGLLTAFTFSVWPVAQAQKTMAQDLFRDRILPNRGRPEPVYMLLVFFGASCLVALAFRISNDTRLTAWFIGGALASFLCFRVLAEGLVRLLRRLPRPRRFVRRLALSNLVRPGNASATVFMSLGMGLTILVAIAAIQGNLRHTLRETRHEDTPAFFFLDLQTDQRAAFARTLSAIPGSGLLKLSPWLRGRLVAVNGVAAAEAIKDQSQEWVLRSDRGISYTNELPAHSEIVAGAWWGEGYQGPPQLSVVREIADAFRIGVGDRVTVNLMGREITLPIANVRDVDWGSLAMNFSFLYSPGLLDGAPHTWLATLHADAAAEPEIQRRVAHGFHNVTIIRLREAMDTLDRVLGQIDMAVSLIALVALLTGVLVLAGAILATHRQRVYDAILLKVLGATGRDILRAFLLEYALLGIATALVAAALGTFAAWGVVTRLMHIGWLFLPGTTALTASAALLITVFFGYLATWRVLRVKPAPYLRHE